MQVIERPQEIRDDVASNPDPAAPQFKQRCRILAKKGFLAAKDITSDVVIVIYSNKFQLGVLVQVTCVEDTCNARLYFDCDGFARSAMAMVLAEFAKLGVRKKDLVINAAGGATNSKCADALSIAAKAFLWEFELHPHACDFGGDLKRSVWMDVESGRVIVRSERIGLNLASADALPVAS